MINQFREIDFVDIFYPLPFEYYELVIFVIIVQLVFSNITS